MNDNSEDIEDLITFADNMNKFNNIILLKKQKLIYADYASSLDYIGSKPKEIAQINKESTGYFYSEKEVQATIRDEKKFFHELYAHEGIIKFIRHRSSTDSTTTIQDTYFNKNIETNLFYETYPENIFDQYPPINMDLYNLFEDLKIIDSLDSYDIHSNKKYEDFNDELDDEDYDDEEYEDLYFYEVDCIYATQEATYNIGKHHKAVLFHDTNKYFKLTLFNEVDSLTLETKLKFNEIQKIDKLLRKEPNKEEIRNYLSDKFKNHDATINNLQRGKYEKTKFHNGISLINML